MLRGQLSGVHMQDGLGEGTPEVGEVFQEANVLSKEELERN